MDVSKQVTHHRIGEKFIMFNLPVDWIFVYFVLKNQLQLSLSGNERKRICLHHRFQLQCLLNPRFQLLGREFPLQALLVPTFLLKSLLFFCLDIFEPQTCRVSNSEREIAFIGWRELEMASCRSHQYSSVAENNVRTLKVCLQQRSSKVT